MPDRRQSRFDDAVVHEPAPVLGLLLGDDEPGPEPMLSDSAADRSGVLAGLEMRDPQLAVELGSPGRRIRVDPQGEPLTAEVEACRGAPA